VTRKILKASIGSPPDAGTGFAQNVASLIAKVRGGGDRAVRELSSTLDGWSPNSFRLGDDEIEQTVSNVPTQTIDDIRWAQAQVRRFAEAQLAGLTSRDRDAPRSNPWT